MCKRITFSMLFIMMSGMVLTSHAYADLVAWWRFDEGSGTIATDYSGNGNDGVLNGGAQWVDGQLGGAIQFNGTNSFVRAPHIPMDSRSHTVTMWVNPVLYTDQQVVFSQTQSRTQNLSIHYRLYGPGAGRVRMGFYSNDLDTSGNTVQDNTWYHLTFWYDFENQDRRIYVDGVQAAQGTSGPFLGTTGDTVIGSWDGSGQWFRGIIDDVQVYDHPLTQAEIESSMMGLGGFPCASRPDPEDGTIHSDTWVTLTWRAGDFAVSHDVYLGDNLEDVSEGIADTFRGNQISTSFTIGFPGFPYPDGLIPGTTYYWRIDEVNEAEPNSPWKGDIWSFSIPPRTAYNPDPADGAEFVDVDATLRWTPGFGAKLHTVYVGTDLDAVDNSVGGAPQGDTSYKPATLEPEMVYYWRVDEFDPPTTYKGDIWGFTTPGAAGNPQPANGATAVAMTAQLSWMPAATAVSHDVYFGADKDAVMNATTASPEYKGNKAIGSESLDPGKLAWQSDYYWRVDAVYSTGTVKGLVWSFTTADFLLVDDFEPYNDIDPPDPNSKRIFDIWIDGFGTTDNGALVGNDLPPYAEQTIVHGGNQSMPYFYDNNLKTSEATLTLVYPRDWTEEGVTKLSLWFRGNSSNAADRIYVALNGNAVVYLDDPAATQKTGWNKWVIDLQAFADQGVNLASVNTITIGIGTKGSPAAGGSGQMYFDDIRLER